MIIEYLTAILVFVTAIYVWLTHQMVESSKASVDAVREQSEALTRPYLVVEPYIRPKYSPKYPIPLSQNFKLRKNWC